jgi:hypothetical protein
MMKNILTVSTVIIIGGLSRTLLAQNAIDPTVTIYATHPWASEIRSAAGTFTVRRTGPTSFPLLVFYRLSGSASNGMDYEELGNNVQIPAGAPDASFNVKPIDDSRAEGTESVLAELTGSPLDCATCGYNIGDPSKAEVLIADNDPVDGTNDPPFLSLNEPQDGDIFRMPAVVTLRAYAQDTEDHFDLQVEFLEGTNSLGFGKFVATTCPAPLCPYFELSWSNAPAGQHLLKARVIDSHGAATVSSQVTIDVIGAVNIYASDPEASEIEIHSAPNIDPPSNPAVFTVRRFGDINDSIVVYYQISGSASQGVDYRTLPGYVTLPQGASSAQIIVQPNDDNLAEGSETVVLTLVPTCPQCLFVNPPCEPPVTTNCYPIGPDNSAVAYIRDSNPTNAPPEVRMIQPPDGKAFPAHSNISLVALAHDAEDGYFDLHVEFFADAHSLGFGTFFPGRCATCPNYGLTWSNVPPGIYTLTAKATDSQGLMNFSFPVEIKVSETNFGTWSDHFHQATLASEWTGDRAFFRTKDGVLEGQSASPLTTRLNLIEIVVDSSDCNVSCWINVVAPNTRVCTKGALILRHTGNTGYVFALHEATQTIEVYRLSNREMLLRKEAKIELTKWYYVRAELRGPLMTFFVDGQLIGTITDTLNPSGAIGLGVEDAEAVWFDDFTISGPRIKGNVDGTVMPEITLVPQSTHENVVFRFVATPPYDYFVLASPSLVTHEWRTIRSFRAKLESFEAEVSDPVTNVLRFYRIEKVPCECR